MWVEGQSSKDLQKLQLNDPDIGPILAAKLSDSRPKSQDMIPKSPACRHYWIIWDVLVIKDGILLKKFFKTDGTGDYLQFLVPRAMKTNIFFRCIIPSCLDTWGVRKQERRSFRDFIGMS